MAGTAENVQVVSTKKSDVFDGELSPTDLNFNTTSLQEMIDSELALRLRAEPEDELVDIGPSEPEQLIDIGPPEPDQLRELGLEIDPSERFLQVERLHSAGTLNVFADTIDLSPDCEHPFIPISDVSPTYENIPFTSPDSQGHGVPLVNVDSDESPVTEDASDLEPIPLFTQTITSDHEQSPLTEVNPFILEVESPKELPMDSPLETSFSPRPVVNVKVIEPPDLSTGVSPEFQIETEVISVEEIDSENIPFKAEVLENGSASVEETETEKIPNEPELISPVVVVTPVDCVDRGVSNSMREVCVANTEEWTTVEDAVKEVQSCEAVEEFEPLDSQLAQDLPTLHNTVSESITTSTTTKTVKKKKSVENGEVASTKTKKTKKTKKSEEKENHISVMTNGHHDYDLSPETDSEQLQWTRETPQEDELSNVCVRDLKQTYVREAAKSCAAPSAVSEEPVPAPVSIRELRRSFCDLKTSREAPDSLPTPFVHSAQLKARSLGDLRRLSESPQPKSIHTGVSVKALAASYWSLVSHEPSVPTLLLTPPPNRNVAHTLRKSSFSKFDQLQKKTVLHVRSSDASKIQKQFNQETPEALGANPTCKSCGKTVFAMEQVKAERSVWHKNCFRCKECSKQLTMDMYQSHEGELFCKPHFKELFKPKAVVDNTEDEPSSDKADLGLEELSALNVKSRFHVFEKSSDSQEVERSPSTVNVKRSPSILSKLAKFQKKGMDVGVTDEILNGVDYEESSSSEDEAQGEDGQVVKASKRPERPISFNKMEDVKRNWETSGSAKTKEEVRAEHKKEISQIRSRLFQGKQGKMKEMYEQAVADSEGKPSAKRDQDIVMSEKARLIKERFERGEVIHSDSDDDDKKAKNKDAEDMSVFEAGISKKSRSLFLELDASAAKTQSTPVTPPTNPGTPRVTERRPQQEGSPEQQLYRDPNVVRADDNAEDETIVKRSQTASRMLSLFRQMEEQKEPVPDGPKPLKCFTPPPDCKEEQSGSSEDEEESEEEEESEDDGMVRSSSKIEDESLKQAQNAARAKSLREKFEHWEPEKQSVNNAINLLDSEQESIESTKSLRARFESLKAEQPKEKPAPKVNRFV